mmetsp:Transcript_11906/g.41757  ORF Transcript_11906/g.41757 Transcript_11906/m.41757 type:complete len:209 (-) Transcript_11906:227-853(-)
MIHAHPPSSVAHSRVAGSELQAVAAEQREQHDGAQHDEQGKERALLVQRAVRGHGAKRGSRLHVIQRDWSRAVVGAGIVISATATTRAVAACAVAARAAGSCRAVRAAALGRGRDERRVQLVDARRRVPRCRQREARCSAAASFVDVGDASVDLVLRQACGDLRLQLLVRHGQHATPAAAAPPARRRLQRVRALPCRRRRRAARRRCP